MDGYDYWYDLAQGFGERALGSYALVLLKARVLKLSELEWSVELEAFVYLLVLRHKENKLPFMNNMELIM